MPPAVARVELQQRQPIAPSCLKLTGGCLCSCSVRLHGSRSVLQIRASGGWRSVCSQGWSAQQGRASCLELGYSRSDAHPAMFSPLTLTLTVRPTLPQGHLFWVGPAADGLWGRLLEAEA